MTTSRRRRWPWVVLIVAVVIVATFVVATGISALRQPPPCGCSGPPMPHPTLTATAS